MKITVSTETNKPEPRIFNGTEVKNRVGVYRFKPPHGGLGEVYLIIPAKSGPSISISNGSLFSTPEAWYSDINDYIEMLDPLTITFQN